MCLPLCEQCGEAIKAEESAIRLQYGYVDTVTQEFEPTETVVLHERCLPYFVV